MNSKDTSNQSSSSDHQQTLLALRDLVEAIVPAPEPTLVSALHQARLVLKKHKVPTGSSQ